MSTILDTAQTLFLFNWTANASGNHLGTSQELADRVYRALEGGEKVQGLFQVLEEMDFTLWGQQGKEGWELVWGPAVFEFEESLYKADNTVYVVHNAVLNIYVVAVAGTNAIAIEDWLKEDLRVGKKKCVNWPINPDCSLEDETVDADPSREQISVGTALGLHCLLGRGKMVPAKSAPASDLTLVDFLTTRVTKEETLIFTGHSLGGALSPTLARWAYDNGDVKAASYYAMPTAGPTPGNEKYQTHWDFLFPQTSLATRAPFTHNPHVRVATLNDNVWNEWDVVPHAWQHIYAPQYMLCQPVYFANFSETSLFSNMGVLEDPFVIRPIVEGAQKRGTEGGMTASAHTRGFSSAWPLAHLDKNGQWKELDKKASYGPAEVEEYFAHLGLVHVWGYGTDAFGLPLELFKKIHDGRHGKQ